MQLLAKCTNFPTCKQYHRQAMTSQLSHIALLYCVAWPSTGQT